MAARRGKAQAARRTSSRKSGTPGWAWLSIGALATLLGVFVVYPKLTSDAGSDGFLRADAPQPDPDAKPSTATSEEAPRFDPATASSEPAQPAPSRPLPAPVEEPANGFDFYEVLPGEEVTLSDAQLAAIQREENRRKAEEERRLARQNASEQQAAEQAEARQQALRRTEQLAAEREAAALRRAEAAKREAASRETAVTRNTPQTPPTNTGTPRATTTAQVTPVRSAAQQAAEAQSRATALPAPLPERNNTRSTAATTQNTPRPVSQTTSTSRTPAQATANASPARTATTSQADSRVASSTAKPRNTGNNTATTNRPANTANQTQVARATPANSTASSDARYLLQAGAFQASGDAEAMKARIALAGLSSRVESTQSDGRTLYRVRLGPYGSATELESARKRLSDNGISTLAIRAR